MTQAAVLALLLSAGPAACDSSGPTKPEPFGIGEEVTLAPGGTGVARDARFELRFVEVVEDSRCPTDVQCVWAGEAKVKVALEAGSAGAAEREVSSDKPIVFGGCRITVVRVRPEPVSTRPIQPTEYRVTFRVAREP